MRNDKFNSTPARNSHWLIRLVRWLFGENLAQWLCMAVLIYFAWCIAGGGHGFDLLVVWIAGNLWISFKPNVEEDHK